MITEEYRKKVENFIKNIPNRIYKPVAEVEFKGFFTYDRMSLDEAMDCKKETLTAGMKWGKKWQYGWFFADIIIPDKLKQKRVVFTADLGEGCVFVNGEAFGSLDREHSYITLSRNAVENESFSIAMEMYAGHSGIKFELEQEHTMCVIPESVLEEFPSDQTQRTVKNGSFGVFHDEVFGLWMDIKTLYGLAENLDVGSLRRAKIEKALCDMCDVVDIELPEEEFLVTVGCGREVLRTVLECKNGSTVPKVFAVGHSHLDLEWLWTVNETRRKIARTVGNQLKLMEEYEDYKYMQSQLWLLQTLKNEYPTLYAKFRKQVADGRISVEGGMWVEADTNIPCGESLIRQFVFGKEFIKREFGTESKILWLPDIFGVTAALPQIMKGCGIKYFMNAKITWQYNGGDKFPYSNFMWQGIDGTQILTNLTQEYATELTPSKVFEKWNMNSEKAEVPIRMIPYGHGDGGGGATRIHLEYLKREGNLEGMPKVTAESPLAFFECLENDCEIKNKYVGELYYAAHRGSYTAQARTKMLNRKCEFALREAELWSALMQADTKSDTDMLWKTVLFNQFHDILPGTSISAVYEKTEKDLNNVIESAKTVALSSIEKAVEPRNGYITVFNSLSWERNVIVKLPSGYTSVYDEDGKPLRCQEIDGEVYAKLNAPSCGAKTYKAGNESAAEGIVTEQTILENSLIKAVFNQLGELISLVDKTNSMEYIKEPSNIFRMYRNAPTVFDAWDIDSFYEKLEVGSHEDIEVRTLYKGELVSALRITQKLNKSKIVQIVKLYENSKRLDFDTEIDWQETHKLLKVDFNTNIHTDELVSEIQYGYIKRPNHKSRHYDEDRFEVCQHKWSALFEGRRGAALLNDCKYGISADDGIMSLTLLTASVKPALNADKGIQRFTYSFLPFSCGLSECDVVKQAYELNCLPLVIKGYTNDCAMLSVSAENVVVDTVKQAEDGSGDVIVRMYESGNSFTRCRIGFGFDVDKVYITNMLEEPEKEIVFDKNAVDVELKTFEVLTLKIKVKNKI